MSRGARYEIEGHIFQTKNDIVQYIRSMVAGYADGASLRCDDLAFMMALLARHPSASQKQGTGVAAMEVRRNPVYPANRGFWLIRTDGSETDFSYYECLHETPHAQRFLRALRVAIEPEIQAYRHAFFAALGRIPYRCPYTGELLGLKSAHVDHQAPDTFQALAQRFVASEDLDIATVQIDGKAADNVLQDTLADPRLRERWVAYHRTYARLQIVSRTANLSLLKRRSASPTKKDSAP